jgi:hypothetical protein
VQVLVKDSIAVKGMPVVCGGYHREGVLEVVLQKSTPTRIRQLIPYYYNFDAKVDGIV